MEFIFNINQIVLVTYRDKVYTGIIVDREIYDGEPDYLIRSDETNFDGCGWFRPKYIKKKE